MSPTRAEQNASTTPSPVTAATAAATIGLSAVTALLGLGWRLSWLATRLDRAHLRTERTWAVLDAALVRRAQGSLAAITEADVDPATALLITDAAARALTDDLGRHDREHAETVLSQVLRVSLPTAVGPEQQRVQLARRLHNDAVATAHSLRSRRAVRLFRLAGRAAEPMPFEIA